MRGPYEAFTAACRNQPLNNLQCCGFKLLPTSSARCWPHGTWAADASLYHLLYRHWHLPHVTLGSSPFSPHHRRPSFILDCFTSDTEPISPLLIPLKVKPIHRLLQRSQTAVSRQHVAPDGPGVSDRGSVVNYFPVKSICRVCLWQLEQSGEISAPEAFSDDSPVTVQRYPALSFLQLGQHCRKAPVNTAMMWQTSPELGTTTYHSGEAPKNVMEDRTWHLNLDFFQRWLIKMRKTIKLKVCNIWRYKLP